MILFLKFKPPAGSRFRSVGVPLLASISKAFTGPPLPFQPRNTELKILSSQFLRNCAPARNKLLPIEDAVILGPTKVILLKTAEVFTGLIATGLFALAGMGTRNVFLSDPLASLSHSKASLFEISATAL